MFLITMSSSRLQFNNALLTVLAVLPLNLGFVFTFRFLVNTMFWAYFWAFLGHSPPQKAIIFITIWVLIRVKAADSFYLGYYSVST